MRQSASVLLGLLALACVSSSDAKKLLAMAPAPAPGPAPLVDVSVPRLVQLLNDSAASGAPACD
jgi:hypothetical protein